MSHHRRNGTHLCTAISIGSVHSSEAAASTLMWRSTMFNSFPTSCFLAMVALLLTVAVLDTHTHSHAHTQHSTRCGADWGSIRVVAFLRAVLGCLLGHVIGDCLSRRTVCVGMVWFEPVSNLFELMFGSRTSRVSVSLDRHRSCWHCTSRRLGCA